MLTLLAARHAARHWADQGCLCQALGLTLLENVIAALGEGAWDKVQHEALQRLVCTVFRRDVVPFRCAAAPLVSCCCSACSATLLMCA